MPCRSHDARAREGHIESAEMMATLSCPACGAPAAPDARFCRECGHALASDPAPDQPAAVAVSATLTVREAIRFGWRTTRRQLPFYLTLTLVYLVVQVVASLLNGATEGRGAGVSLLVILLDLAVGAVVSAGVVTATLKSCDGLQPSLSDLLPPSHVVMRYLLVVAMLYGMFLPGIILWLYVPAVGALLLLALFLTFGVRLGFAPYAAIDRALGPADALRASFRITEGFRGLLLRLLLVSTGIVLLGLLCLVVGVLVAAPVVWIAWAYAYRRLLARAAAGAGRTETV